MCSAAYRFCAVALLEQGSAEHGVCSKPVAVTRGTSGYFDL